MSFLDTMRSGLKFVLMSMGVSSPAKKPAPPGKPDLPKPGL
jgi:hypothetical protein